MVRHIIFGGIDTRDYDAIVDGAETYGGAERDYESVPVPGRNGELTVDKGRYKNIPLPYNMLFKSRDLMEEYRSRIMSLTGYHRLVDSRHMGEYREARVTGAFEPTMHGVCNRSGEVTVTFDCMPQRFLTSGEIPVEILERAAILNPTGQAAKPLFRVFGSGRLTVGTVMLEIAEHGGEYVDIDCDLGECYREEENLNWALKRDGDSFPVLGQGETVLEPGAGIERLIIYPRWWRV